MSMLKLKKLIAEAQDPKVEKLIKDIQKKTENNDHTESIIVLAKFLKDGKMVKVLDAINDIHHIEGNMPSQLSQYRSEVLNKLLATVKNKYDSDIYNRISGSF